MTARPLKERDIEKALVAGARTLGGEVRKVVWQGRRGAPDRFVMLPVGRRHGQFEHLRSFWVELKAPGVKPEPYQLREHERMRALGQRVFVVDSLSGVSELLA